MYSTYYCRSHITLTLTLTHILTLKQTHKHTKTHTQTNSDTHTHTHTHQGTDECMQTSECSNIKLSLFPPLALPFSPCTDTQTLRMSCHGNRPQVHLPPHAVSVCSRPGPRLLRLHWPAEGTSVWTSEFVLPSHPPPMMPCCRKQEVAHW